MKCCTKHLLLHPVKGDWAEEVKTNLTELNICLELEDIKNKSKSSFKNLVKVKTQEYTLNYLLNKKEIIQPFL